MADAGSGIVINWGTDPGGRTHPADFNGGSFAFDRWRNSRRWRTQTGRGADRNKSGFPPPDLRREDPPGFLALPDDSRRFFLRSPRDLGVKAKSRKVPFAVRGDALRKKGIKWIPAFFITYRLRKLSEP